MLRSFAKALALVCALGASSVHASQDTTVLPLTGPMKFGGADGVASRINDAFQALATCNSGSIAPANGAGDSILKGWCWLDTSGAPNVLKFYDGGNWLTLFNIDTSGHTATVPVSAGGTGLNTLTNHGVLVGAGASGLTPIAVPASGTLFQGVSGSDPVWSATPTLGVAGTTAGTLSFSGATSGTTKLQSTSAASGTLTLPAATDTLIGKATTDTLTNKTFDTAGTGNSFSINGLAATANTGTGAVVRATSPSISAPTVTGHPTIEGVTSTGATGTGKFVFDGSPTLVTPNLGVASATTINKVTITAPASGSTLTIPDGVTLTGPAVSGTAMTLGNAETVTGAKSFNAGKLILNGSSGATTLNAAATASGTLTLPAATDTLIGKATTDTLTNKTFDTAGTGNSFSINGLAATANTGTGSVVRATSPTLVTPTLGIASATTINKVTITAPASGSTLTVADGKTLTASNTLTLTGTDSSSVAFGAGGTVAYTANNLGAFASTTSAQLAGVLSDETGSGVAVFGTAPTISAPTISGHPTVEGVTSTGATGTGKLVFDGSPTLVTPNLGTPSAINLSNATSLPISAIASLGAGVGTWLATPSSANLASALTDKTGTGAAVFGTSPTLGSPTINTPTLSGGTIDNALIGASTPVAITATSLTATQKLRFNNAVTATQITADQDDYTGTDGSNTCSTLKTVRLSSDAARNITGLSCSQSGGDIVVAYNAGSFAITLKDEGVSSTAGNRFGLGADLILASKQGATLIYDGTASRWRQIGGPSASGGGSGTVTQVICGAGLDGGAITTSGTCSVSSARRTLPTTQILTSGSGTYTTPSNVLWIDVYMVGGGGGGPGSSASGGNGGNATATCWNTTGAACTSPVYSAGGGNGGTANGGAGGGGGTISGSGTCIEQAAGQSGQGGTNSGPTVNTGPAGAASFYGGAGRGNPNGAGGAATANSGSGGASGSAASQIVGGSGGAGAWCHAIIGGPAATYTYVVGSGGTAGTAGGGNAGGAGAAGKIVVIEHYGT